MSNGVGEYEKYIICICEISLRNSFVQLIYANKPNIYYY
jgi:hypothetical protein